MWLSRSLFWQCSFRSTRCEVGSNVHRLTRSGAVEISIALFMDLMECSYEISTEWDIQFVRLSRIAHVQRTMDLDGANGETFRTRLLATLFHQCCEGSIQFRLCL